MAVRWGSGGDTAAPSADAGLHHIHGLGVSGETLYIATHTGLWTVPPGRTKAQRFGDSAPGHHGLLGRGEWALSGSG